MKFSSSVSASYHDGHDDIEYLTIVNEKREGGNNYLHMLIDHLTDENYDEVVEMIKILLADRCSPNFSNDNFETPFYVLLIKFLKINDKGGLIRFFLENDLVHFNSHSEILDLVKSSGHGQYRVSKPKPFKDLNFMVWLCEQWNETGFINEFDDFKVISRRYHNEIAQLLEEAIVRNLVRVAKFLLVNGADVNEARQLKAPPAFLACSYGRYEILKVLMNDPTMEIVWEETQQSLLHAICEVKNVHAIDRQKCFDLIVTDSRCTVEIINGEDGKLETALFYASQNGFGEMSKELLRRGAYIGHQSVVNNMQQSVLKEFLDDCISASSDVRDKNCQIHVDYRFLVPPEIDGKSHKESHSLKVIAKNRNVEKLLLHPVIDSFLQIKWKKIDYLVYLNLLIYFCFMIFLGSFIILFFKRTESIGSNAAMNSSEFGEMNETLAMMPKGKPDMINLLLGIDSNEDDSKAKRSIEHPKNWNHRFRAHFNNNAIYYRICVIGSFFMLIYEIIQCATSFKSYFFKIENWLDLTLITLSYFVLIASFDIDPENFKKLRAVTILVMAAQTMQLIAKVSFLSMSLHMAIFKRVCVTFIKTIALYLILILAFAMAFYTLNSPAAVKAANRYRGDKDDSDVFADPLTAIIITVRMMLADFEYVNIESGDYFQSFIFLLFIVLITVVLFNLLNALAIRDTRQITVEAELIAAKKRISILNSFENLSRTFKITFANVFPEMKSIMLTPNIDYTIKVKRTLESDAFSDQKAEKTDKFEEIHTAKWKFWRRDKVAMVLNSKSVKKIVDFIENRDLSMERVLMDLQAFSYQKRNKFRKY